MDLHLPHFLFSIVFWLFGLLLRLKTIIRHKIAKEVTTKLLLIPIQHMFGNSILPEMVFWLFMLGLNLEKKMKTQVDAAIGMKIPQILISYLYYVFKDIVLYIRLLIHFRSIKLLIIFIIILFLISFRDYLITLCKYHTFIFSSAMILIFTIPHIFPYEKEYEPIIHGTYGPKPEHSVMFRELWEYMWELVQIWLCRGQDDKRLFY